MEVLHHILGIVTVLGRDPLIMYVRVPLPFDQIMYLSPSHLGVQYFLHFILLLLIDYHWQWGWKLLSAGKGGCMVGVTNFSLNVG